MTENGMRMPNAFSISVSRRIIAVPLQGHGQRFVSRQERAG